MKKRNWWKIGGVAGIVSGIAVLVLAVHEAGDTGSLFRQGWTGLFLCALGGAALYADQTGEEDKPGADDEG